MAYSKQRKAEILAEIARLHALGLNNYSIAAATLVSYQTTGKYVHDLGLTPRRNRARLTEDQAVAIRRDHDAGRPWVSIADRNSVSYPTVFALLSGLALTPNHRQNRLSDAQIGSIREAHAAGLGNRQIAEVAGVHHRSVGKYLNDLGLQTNNPRGTPPEPVDESHSRCWKCNEVRPNSDFALSRSAEDGRRLSYCRPCRAVQNERSVRRSPESFFANRQRRQAKRAARLGVDFDLRPGYLAALWYRQDGKCFYTDMTLDYASAGEGLRNSISVDRVVPDLGYVEGNVVLCSYRANTVKQDLSLEEVAAWMPGWHERIVSRLPVLLDGLAPVDEGPLRSDGARAARWIVEHHARMATYGALP